MNANSPYRLIIIWLFSITILVLCIDAIIPQDSNTKVIKTKLQLTSNELIVKHKTKAEDVLKDYIESALEIEGVIKKITTNKGIYTLLLEGHDDQHFVICEMQKDQEQHITNLSVGDTVIVKGIYKGTLIDAILLNCIVLKTF